MDFSKITDDLFIGPMPKATDYDLLQTLGVRLVLNMRFARKLPRGVSKIPIEVLWLRTFDNPLLPIPIHLLEQGAQAALGIISQGGKIYTHCAYGRHRSVAMGAAILIAQGYTPGQAIELIKARRQVADPDVFYIRWRILRFAEVWQARWQITG